MSKVKLTREDVLHVAKLSNLSLTDAEVDKFVDQLSSIVDFVSELEEVDTTNVEPTSQTTGLSSVLREDEIKVDNSLTTEEAVSGSDKVHNNMFKVPAILTDRSV